MRSIEQITADNQKLESYGLIAPGSAVGTAGFEPAAISVGTRVKVVLNGAEPAEGGADYYADGYTGEVLELISPTEVCVRFDQDPPYGGKNRDWWCALHELVPESAPELTCQPAPSRTDGLQDWSVGDTYPFTIVAHYDPELDVQGAQVVDAITGIEYGDIQWGDTQPAYELAAALKAANP